MRFACVDRCKRPAKHRHVVSWSLFCERIAEKFSSQMHAAMACINHANESVAAHQTPVATYKIERKIYAIGLHNAHIRLFFCTFLHSKCKSSEQRHRMCSSLSTPHLLPKKPSDRSNLVMFNYQRNAKPIRLFPPRDLVSAPGCHTNA